MIGAERTRVHHAYQKMTNGTSYVEYTANTASRISAQNVSAPQANQPLALSFGAGRWEHSIERGHDNRGGVLPLPTFLSLNSLSCLLTISSGHLKLTKNGTCPKISLVSGTPFCLLNNLSFAYSAK